MQEEKSLAIDDKGSLYIWGCVDIYGVQKRLLTPVLWSKQEFVLDAQYIGTFLYVQSVRNTFLFGENVKAIRCGKQYGTCELIGWILGLLLKNITKIFQPKSIHNC